MLHRNERFHVIKEASTEALEQELGKAKTKIIQEYFASN
jgi:hypothetical protein